MNFIPGNILHGEKKSNMQLADLNSKHHGGKVLRNLIDYDIGSHFYTLPGSVKYKLIHLDQIHGPSHINCEQKKKSDIKTKKTSNARNYTTKPLTTQI